MGGGSLNTQYITTSELHQCATCTIDDCGSGKLPLEERASIVKQGDPSLRRQCPGMSIKVASFSSFSDMTLALESAGK